MLNSRHDIDSQKAHKGRVSDIDLLEVTSCKLDRYDRWLTNKLASGISALAVGFDKQYEITKSNSTDETRADLERCCAPLTIIADVFHAISLHRRYSILPFLDGNVRKFSDTCPIDEFLFGKTFPDQWKSASEAQRLGFSIKKKEKALGSSSSKPIVYKKLEPKPGPSRVPSSLNSRRQQHKSRMKKEAERFRSARSYRKQ
ncbi:unnamed protein product [Acanthoscelides obtectus]|uniref:Uncharacterized protein n=1 Tax=Acanthoscelides obtectus TaxID=200917 RepID=A0A9P0LLG8_ACAOB|nr:unnamed protein product [Acanthoscelides obtectus]CAK1643785.1 hypothetical protein AOBTE_LOCUS13672 [Acanthoscelides obtectus]